MVKEQRKHSRHLTDIVVSFRNASPGLLVPEQGVGNMENISLGGLFLMSDEPMPIGTLVDLEFDLGPVGGRRGAVRARAKVRWNRTRFEPRGMGMEFVEFRHGRGTLEKWLGQMENEKRS